MVAPIIYLANKHLFTLAFNLTSSQIAKTPASKAIDINNFDNIRRRSTSPSKTSSRSPSISSTTSSISYHKKIEINNDLPDKEFTESVDISISKTTDNSFNRN